MTDKHIDDNSINQPLDLYSEESMVNARVSEWYDRVTSSLDKCPFCDLKDKYIIVEKDGVVLSVNLFPYIDGHLMVIPRRHIEKFEEINDEEWHALKSLLDTGIKIVKDELKVENTNILYREGGSSGISLRHLHVHILPITPEFMQYHKTHFIWEFQKLEVSPLKMAERMRKAVGRLQG